MESYNSRFLPNAKRPFPWAKVLESRKRSLKEFQREPCELIASRLAIGDAPAELGARTLPHSLRHVSRQPDTGLGSTICNGENCAVGTMAEDVGTELLVVGAAKIGEHAAFRSHGLLRHEKATSSVPQQSSSASDSDCRLPPEFAVT